ncbi:MAG: cyanophycinase [Planctomycetes bacterium]|nr:cyanophycinase [Planctomycetota bacterium]
MSRVRLVVLLLAAVLAASCRTARPRFPRAAEGALLLIGGGLDDDQQPVFDRFLALAGRDRPPRIVVVTAASGDQDDMATGKVAALQTWWPGLPCEVVRRETTTEATVAAIDRATGLFFTGGDQQRITDRYRPGGRDTPEWLAMRRLLQRGGVIAGSSAGCAMMGERMLLGGSSGDALGDGGPRVGPGMLFEPWVMTDSHFFERHRTGRLVAALEATGQRLGIGVSEDGCVELDLATGVLTGIGTAEALLLDIGALHRDGPHRRAVRALRVPQSARIDLRERLQRPVAAPPPRPPAAPAAETIVEEGQNRQLASWRLFARAAEGGVWQLALDGHRLVAWPAGDGESVFDVEVGTAPAATDTGR